MKLNKLFLPIIALISFNAFAESNSTNVVDQYAAQHKEFEVKKRKIAEQKRLQIEAQKNAQKLAEVKRYNIKKIEDRNINQMSIEDQASMTLLKNSPTSDYRPGTTLVK